MRHGMTDEQLIEEIQKNLLQPEDTFLFGCKQCGNCCRNREELITVTGYDIYNIAKAMGVSAAEAAMKYCTISPGQTSALPVAHLKERLDGSCSLLRKGLCMVQKDKPIVCRLYPVGRYYDGKEQRYFRQGAGTCTGHGQEIKLKDWLEEFNIPALDEASVLWGKFIFAASLYARNLKEKRKAEEYVEFFKDAGLAFYMRYDLTLPVEENIKNNIKWIEERHKGFNVK